GQRDLITVLGHAAVISAGEFVQASGAWQNDRTHGVQFRASFLKAMPPTTTRGIEKYLGSGMISHRRGPDRSGADYRRGAPTGHRCRGGIVRRPGDGCPRSVCRSHARSHQHLEPRFGGAPEPEAMQKAPSQFIIAARAQASRRCETQATLSGKAAKLR